ncbi:endolysin [Bacillus phage Silence]|nr:endolysin [Bacillus phage Silence]
MTVKFFFDFGHGKKRTADGRGDPGAVNEKEGLIESDLVEIIGGHAAEFLKNNYTGFEIGYTRKDDSFVSLSNRCKKANAWGADYFISFHINAGGGTGYESFVYTNASSKSVALQNMINAKAIAAAKKHGLGVHGDASKRKNLAVLRGTTMPAVLTETCFIDSSRDIKLLKNSAFLKDMGYAYGQALAEFTGLPKKAVSKPAPSVPASTGIKLLVVEYDGKDGLNYRSKPDYTAKPVGVARKGDAFTIVDEEGDFYKVKSGYYFTKNPKYVSVKTK